MEQLAKLLPRIKKFQDYIDDVSKSNFPINISGLSESAKAHFVYATKFFTNKPVVVLTYNEIELKKLQKDLEFFEDDEILVFPKREIVYYDIDTTNKDISMQRLDVFQKLYKSEVKIILTTVEAIMQKTMPKNTLFSNVLHIEIGKEYNLEEIKENLINIGYERSDLCDSKGQFSVRGGIIDVYPPSEKDPIRIEFWGDEVDSIRHFDAISQRSIEAIQSVSIFPVEEFIVNRYKLDDVANKIANHYEKQIEKYSNIKSDIDEIKNGEFQNKVEKYFEFFFDKTSSFIDYLPKDVAIFIDEPVRIKSKAQSIEYENKEIIEQYIEKYGIVPSYTSNMAGFSEIAINLEEINAINLFRIDENMHAKRNGYSFSCREVNFFRGNVDIFLQEIQEARTNGNKIIILGGTISKCRSLATMLLEHNVNSAILENNNQELFEKAIEEADSKKVPVLIMQGDLSTGYVIEDINLYIVAGENQGVVKEKKRSYKPKAFQEGSKVVFADLKVGDYVVHSTHGIGEYIGIHSLVLEGVRKDYIKIKYKDDDVLYVPTDQLENIRKYMGKNEDTRPRLNKLGSKDFEKTKQRVKNSLRNIAKGLIELYAKRSKQVGYSFSKDTVWQNDFEDSFPFQETDDQLRCIEEVKKDMEAERPMDRLLCGDVGYGKTEVAIRAAFKACMDSKQVAYLCPTTVLSQQQYETFKIRMTDYPITVAVLNRFKTTKQKNEIVKKLKTGEIDILIGTHKILGKEIEFKDLGLLIIDEEHRFGVAHKEKIKELKNNVDVLTMTATPIPRTLHMSIVGIRDMSVIYDPPQNRKPIQTYVLEYDEDVIKEAIIKELERQGQVFYLYNNVENIEEKASEISKLVPEARVAFAHGQMSGKEIENIMDDFAMKDIDVLVCTTIMESGIDIPNANTMIIENADRLGLAQLYQIRGRVGRSDKAAYAYITYRKNKILSETSEKRLKAIKEFTEFGSGFKIALRDLEIRGAGNILGAEQSGHMESVGYEMYTHLLEEAVKELSGEEVEKPLDITIDIKVSAFIPDEYISNTSQKIEAYQDIANITNEEQISEICDEFIDRYGEMPNELFNLLEIARIKCYARSLKCFKIMQTGPNIVFSFVNADFMDDEALQMLLDNFKRRVYFSGENAPIVTLKLHSTNESDTLKDVLKFFKIIAN